MMWLNPPFRHVLSIVVAALIMSAVCAPAHSQWRPTEPITFIVMAGKGGGADKAVRFMTKIMVERSLVPVDFKVVNLSGGSGAEAMAELKRRSGDNHTLMFTLNSFYTTPIRQPQLNVDIMNFTPIGRMAEDAFVLWVHSDRTDINSFDDFLKAARGAGEKWVMSGTGKGAEDNLLTDFLNVTFGLKMTYRPLKGGGAVAKELVEKKANSTVNNPSEQRKYYAAGLTKPILVFTPQRLPAYAATPTLREARMDFHYYMQRSVVGAPGMSAAAQAYYQTLFRELFKSAEWQGYRSKNSLGGDFITGDPLKVYWDKERLKHERWGMVIEVMRGN